MQYTDLTVGRVIECGGREVTEEEIVAFARRYDPQPFHVDPDSAEARRWGGLIASGWMTCSIAMELIVRHVLQGSKSIGSPGIEEIRWEGPVRAGDFVSVRTIVLEQRPSSNGRYGVVRWRWEMRNQQEVRVMHLTGTSLFDIGTGAS